MKDGSTKHLLCSTQFKQMKKCYENGKGIFFEDHCASTLPNPLFTRIRNLPDVLMTGHQGFLTCEAMQGIARTTCQNLDEWQQFQICKNEINLS